MQTDAIPICMYFVEPGSKLRNETNSQPFKVGEEKDFVVSVNPA
jgi:hypothetical protein